MSDNPPGWHRDPSEPTTQRYWDGEGWVGDRLPIDATPPEGPLHAAPAVDISAPDAAVVPDSGMPPGAFPPGAYPPGAFPPGAYPPGMLPPGMLPPGAFIPGAYPPGAYPPGMLPPGAFPPGAYPPGTHPAGPGDPNAATLAPPAGTLPPGFPYTYGAYVLAPIPRLHGFDLASLGHRFCARLVDIAAVLALNAVLNGYLIYRFAQQIGPYFTAVAHAKAAGEVAPSGGSLSTLALVIPLFAMIIWGVYEVPSTGQTGQTLGKRLMHIRVMPLEGDHALGGRRALRRFIPMGLPMLAWGCGVGFLIQLFDSLSPTFNRPLRLAWHDVYAATAVVAVPAVEDVPEANGGLS